jgi:hypothetical protein
MMVVVVALARVMVVAALARVMVVVVALAQMMVVAVAGGVTRVLAVRDVVPAPYPLVPLHSLNTAAWSDALLRLCNPHTWAQARPDAAQWH